jgi:hypothetical protein
MSGIEHQLDAGEQRGRQVQGVDAILDVRREHRRRARDKPDNSEYACCQQVTRARDTRQQHTAANQPPRALDHGLPRAYTILRAARTPTNARNAKEVMKKLGGYGK